jgi:hypothetical protein
MPSGAMWKRLGNDHHWHFGMGWDQCTYILILLNHTNDIVYIYYIYNGGKWG